MIVMIVIIVLIIIIVVIVIFVIVIVIVIIIIIIVIVIVVVIIIIIILVAYLHKILGSPGQLALLQPAIVHHIQASTHRLSKPRGRVQHGIIAVRQKPLVCCVSMPAQAEI